MSRTRDRAWVSVKIRIPLPGWMVKVDPIFWTTVRCRLANRVGHWNCFPGRKLFCRVCTWRLKVVEIRSCPLNGPRVYNAFSIMRMMMLTREMHPLSPNADNVPWLDQDKRNRADPGSMSWQANVGDPSFETCRHAKVKSFGATTITNNKSA